MPFQGPTDDRVGSYNPLDILDLFGLSAHCGNRAPTSQFVHDPRHLCFATHLLCQRIEESPKVHHTLSKLIEWHVATENEG